MDHKCPKDNCGEQIPSHLLACSPHWYDIPKPIRDEVNKSWRAYNKYPGRSNSTKLRRYIAAREAAVTCLNG